jgi:hypothetical protein
MMMITFSTSTTDSLDVSPTVAGSTDNVWDDVDIMVRIRRGGECTRFVLLAIDDDADAVLTVYETSDEPKLAGSMSSLPSADSFRDYLDDLDTSFEFQSDLLKGGPGAILSSADDSDSVASWYVFR